MAVPNDSPGVLKRLVLFARGWFPVSRFEKLPSNKGMGAVYEVIFRMCAEVRSASAPTDRTFPRDEVHLIASQVTGSTGRSASRVVKRLLKFLSTGKGQLRAIQVTGVDFVLENSANGIIVQKR